MSAAPSSAGLFDGIPTAPADPILGLGVAFKADAAPTKQNLGIGAYRDDTGVPWVLPVVHEAEVDIVNDKSLNHEYLPIEGLADFCKVTAKLLLGDDAASLKEGRVATCQSLSGTGALRLGMDLLAKFLPTAGNTTVYISRPTWGNHRSIVQAAGMKVAEYAYYDARTNGLDLAGMLADLEAAPAGSVVLLHVCAHNPTGVDPTVEQWGQIADVVARKHLVPFFDSAYQGFASGDPTRDAASVRLFEKRGFAFLAAQSYSKNFGLYNERIGALSVVCTSAATAAGVLSQIKPIARATYSNPPAHGARIVAKVLGDAKRTQQWHDEVKTMAARIHRTREGLYAALQRNQTPGDWSHILKQIGMFSYTGLNQAQSQRMTDEFHIYMTTNGRISMAGLNDANYDYVADAMKAVLTTGPTANK